MTGSEQERHELTLALERAIGTDPARTLMEQLPPRPWDHLATQDDLGQFSERIDGRLQTIDDRFDQVDDRFVQVDARFAQVDARFVQVDARFDRLERRLDIHDGRFGRIEGLLERFDERFVSLEHRLLAEFRGQMMAQNRLLFFSMMGAVFTAASLAFAAVRF